MKMLRCFMLTVGLLFCLCSQGQQPGDTILLDMRSGLSESRVRSIVQMPDGRMAIATTTTIDIFDGTRFKAFRLPPEHAYPLPEYQGNRQLSCDTLGCVWLRNKQTLYVVDVKRGHVVGDVKTLLQERRLTNGDIARWPTAPDPPTPLTWDGVFRDETVTAYTHDSLGGLWIGTKDYGVLYINPRRIHQFVTAGDRFAHEPRPIFCSPRASRLSSRLAPSGTNCSYEEHSRYLYIGTLYGVLIVDQRDSIVAIVNEHCGLQTNNVSALLADSRGNVWATTAGGGISRIRVVGRDSFDIESYGLLDGIDTEGREFQNGHIHRGSDGRMTAGFVGGTVSFFPDSVGISQYVFRWPREDTEDRAEADKAMPQWPLLLMLILLGVGVLLYLRRTRLLGRPATPAIMASQETVERLKATETPSQDMQFAVRLQQTVEQNISNEDFSVQQLSEQMAMERTVLYRRMQALGLGSPSAYIKRIRMEVAARLLRETGLPVGEVAMRSGFTNAKYFSITFKQTFGKSPKVFREETVGKAD